MLFIPISLLLIGLSFRLRMTSGIEVRLSAYDIVAFVLLYMHVRLTVSLEPLASLYVTNLFLSKNTLISCPYFMAPLALANGSWSAISSFLLIIYLLEKMSVINGS